MERKYKNKTGRDHDPPPPSRSIYDFLESIPQTFEKNLFLELQGQCKHSAIHKKANDLFQFALIFNFAIRSTIINLIFSL